MSHYETFHTGWRRWIGCLELQVSFRKRATNYRALLQEIIHKDKASNVLRHPVLSHVSHTHTHCIMYTPHDTVCHETLQRCVHETVWYSVSWDITSCNVSCLSHTHTLYHVHTSHTLYNVYSSLSHTHCIMYTECESDIILRECLTHTVYTLYSVYMMSHTHCIIYTPRTYTVGSLAK